MPSGFWENAQALFAELVELPVEERRRRLDADTGLSPELRTEVASLLEAHAQADRVPRQVADLLGTGDMVGAFRLTSLIGEGGMGRVFRAERAAGGFAQRVAVKLIDVQNPVAVRRFSAERQILAELSHPHIVALIDGGLTTRGQPYLVMEFVDGVSVVEHCETVRPSLAARLRLAARIASAVQYAHQRGVIHRDLKPANILVTADGSPKVLDFGIATAFGDAGWMSTRTSIGQPTALTMAYASPEQVCGRPATPASDIYSLGVITYEILTGVRPYDLHDLGLDEVIQRVSAGRHAPASQAKTTASLPYALSALKGRIEMSVRHAMAADPSSRFASAGDLQHELEACAAVADAAALTGRAAGAGAPPKRGLAVAGLIGVIGLGGYALWPGRGAESTTSTANAPGPASPAQSNPVSLQPPVLSAPPARPAEGTTRATPPPPDRGSEPRKAPVTSPPPAAIPPPAADDPGSNQSPSMQRATQLRDKAIAAMNAGRAGEASDLMSQVIVIRREHTKMNPADPLTQARLAWSLAFLARARLAAKELTLAETAATEATAIAERLAPIGPGYRVDFAAALQILGAVYSAAGRAEPACVAMTRARSELDAVSVRSLTPDGAERANNIAEALKGPLSGCGAQAG